MGLMDKVFGKDDDDKKKKADFSNVQSGASSTAPAARPMPGPVNVPGAAPAAPAARTYTVKAGDSLSKIAQREYGDASEWKKIHAANRDLIPNPDLIHPGQVLKLP
jgi:nucleoid-associated protein YgaU